MNYRFFLSITALLGIFSISFAGTSHDSLPTINPEYKGFRLAVTDVETNQTEDVLSFQFTLINTGVEDIELGENNSIPEIILNIDESVSNSALKFHKDLFIQNLFNSSLLLKAGDILYDQKIEFKVKNNESLASQITPVQENNSSKASAIAKGGSPEENQCSDLVIESVSIVKKSKNNITLKYKIKNQGKQAVSIVGPSKSQDDNLALTFHMSSSEKLTRGSIPIGGTFVKNGKQIPDGKLYPGKSLTDEVKLDIQNMTRFTPIIILELDPYLSVQECNETNNINHIKVKQE